MAGQVLNMLSSLISRASSRWGHKSKKEAKQKPRLVLSVEPLEGRLLPATFTWTNAVGNGLWDEPGNWTVAGTAQTTAYPGNNGGANTTGDSAVLTGNSNVLLSLPITLSNLQLQNNYNGVFSLLSTLTVSGGGQLAGGSIRQRTVFNSGSLVLTGGDFFWSGGSINPNNAAGKGTLTVSGGSLFCQQTRAVSSTLGSDLIVGGSGNVSFGNIDAIALENGANISNAGVILITESPGGLVVTPGHAMGLFSNTGSISKIAASGGGRYDIGMPLSTSGSVTLSNGSLSFVGFTGGGSPGTGYSVNQTAGTFSLGTGTQLNVALPDNAYVRP